MISDLTKNPFEYGEDVAKRIGLATEKYDKIVVKLKENKWSKYIMIYSYDKDLKRVKVVDKIQVD